VHLIEHIDVPSVGLKEHFETGNVLGNNKAMKLRNTGVVFKGIVLYIHSLNVLQNEYAG
jgi:hypothetical protein